MPEIEELEEKSTVAGDEGEDRAEFLQTMRKQFEDDCADEKAIREQSSLDLRFVIGDQWDARIKNDRTTKNRPVLTFNRCHTFVQQVANEAREKKMQIKYVMGDGGDQDTADVKEGIARHIQYSSEAQIAYETASDYMAGGSFGYIGCLPDYVSDDSDGKEAWDQELKIRAFFDPHAVYGILIPSCFGLEPQHAFVVEELPKAEYKRLYKTDDIDNVGWDQAIKLSQGWIGTDTIRVAEYWWIEYDEKTITRKNPTTKKQESRVIRKPRVKFCKSNGLSVIPDTETEWKGYCIPIVPVLGKQIIVEGKPNLFSVVRFQRDPQILINAYKTRIAETIGTAPIQPYIAYEGQMEGHEAEWRAMNTSLKPWLTIKPVYGPNNELLPPPQRQTFESPIQALTAAAAAEIDDMKAGAGIYDASLGARSNVISGLAKKHDEQQANVTNMHFMDNHERALKKLGKIVSQAMPFYYDTDRMQRILGADEKQKIVRINAAHQDSSGKPYHYKVGGKDSGVYEPIIDVGRSFDSKRMESFDMMSSAINARPELLDIVGDEFFRQSDMAGSDIMSERMKRYIQLKMPGLIDDKENDPVNMLNQAKAQLAQTQQQLQALHAYAQQLEKEKEGKVIEMQGKVQMQQAAENTKLEIIRMQEATKLAVAQINASKDAHQTIADQEIEQYKLLHQTAHEVATQAADQAHERSIAEMQHQQTLEQGEQAAANQSALADQQAQNDQAASPDQGSAQGASQ